MMNRRNIFKSARMLSLATIAGLSGLQASAQEMMVNSSGAFEGRSNHETSGSVKIITEGGRRFVELGDNFMLDGGPDPHVAFGKDGEYDSSSTLGALLSLSGRQRYAVSATTSIEDFNEVYIWCDVAGVPLGVASLNLI